MSPQKKVEVLIKLELILEDFQMLRDGTWVPDEKTCNSCISIVQDVINTIENG